MSSSQIDEQFGLGILSWAHLVSLQVSQALQVQLGKQSLTVDWFWKEMAETKDTIKKKQSIHEFFKAEREVFSLLNPLILPLNSISHDRRFVHHEWHPPADENISSFSPVHQLKVSYSSQIPSQLSAYELHLCLGQDFQWQINLRPEHISQLKLNTRWLSSSGIISMQSGLPNPQALDAIKSLSHLSQSVFYALSLMIQHIDKQN